MHISAFYVHCSGEFEGLVRRSQRGARGPAPVRSYEDAWSRSLGNITKVCDIFRSWPSDRDATIASS